MRVILKTKVLVELQIHLKMQLTVSELTHDAQALQAMSQRMKNKSRLFYI